MIIKSVKLRNFRCFKACNFDFDKKIVLIEGQNGSGKTSLLEALYYACYLRSFKTRLGRELVSFDADHFFIQVDFDQIDEMSNQIQVGHSQKDGKSIKLNKKQVKSFKEIISHYRIISVSEDDIQLIKGAPEERRAFLNQSLFLLDEEFLVKLKIYKQVLEQRNSFLLKNSIFTNNLKDELYTWTQQLWEKSIEIQQQRIHFLKDVEKELNKLLNDNFEGFESIKIRLEYVPRNLKIKETFEIFWDKYQQELLEKEFRWGRSLFGLHLDDFSISFKKKRAKFYASRGEQKLVLFLLKVEQLLKVKNKGENGALLLDDFLTDFDSKKLNDSLFLLKKLDCQVFITCPIKSFIFPKISKIDEFQIIEL